MLNLLPLQHKKKVLAEYHRRLATVFLAGVLFILVVAGVLLVPSLVLVKTKQNTLNFQTADLKLSLKLQKQSDDALKSVVDQTTQTLKAIKVPTSQNTASQLITETAAATIPGVTLNHISYVKTAFDGPVSIEIAGVASSRQQLIDFATSLDGTGLYKNTSFPVSSFVHEKSINFSLPLQVIKK
ncbi:MAG: hypothetical protein PHF79_02805 [Candidatus Pacebacteria bacterium]|nr:hypothetical protein [Candidatus Paceibacterota bacterium]